MRNQDREQRSVSNSQGNLSKVLDFSADNDNEPDSNGDYTGATLEAGPLPESFTICVSIMVDAWTTDITETRFFTILEDGDIIYPWGYVILFSAESYTEYSGKPHVKN